MSKTICLLLTLFAVGLTSVYAFTSKQRACILNAVRPIVTNCSLQHGVTYAEIRRAQETGCEHELDPCFLGCVLRNCGLLDDDCIYKEDTALDLLKPFLAPEDMRVYRKRAKNCGYVNDGIFCDVEDCCQIAIPLLWCYKENWIEVILTEKENE